MSNPVGPPEGSAPGVPAAVQSVTMQLLRELLDVATQVGPAVAKRAEMSRTELSALELLLDHQLGPTELARHLQVTSAASSGIVDRLETRGHLRREPDEQDRRRTRLVVTDSARREVIGHLMPMFAALADLDDTLDEQERAVVERFLEGAIGAIRRLT